MAEHSPALSEQWVPVTGGEIRVRRRTTPAIGGATRPATPVVFVHGAFVNGHLWDGVMAALAAGDPPLDLIAPDLPLGAHHRPMAEGTPLPLTAVSRMIIDVLDALDVEHAVVVANDSGGAVTQQMLADHPERFTGVLLTPTETSDNFPPRYFRHLLPPLQVPALTWVTCQLLRTHRGRRLPITFGHLVRRRMDAPEVRRLMGPSWSSRGARRDLRAFLAGATGDADVLRRAEVRFASVLAAVDVAWTVRDRIFPDADATRLAAAFPGGRRVADVTDSGSLSPVDQPGQVAARLLDLLTRVYADNVHYDN